MYLHILKIHSSSIHMTNAYKHSNEKYIQIFILKCLQIFISKMHTNIHFENTYEHSYEKYIQTFI